jgi:biopolymer transport protein ExbB
MALLSVVIMAVLKHRVGAFMPPKFVEELDRRLQDKNYREAIELAGADPSAFAQMMHAALSQAARGYGAMEQALEEVADNLNSRRIRSLVWMEVAGAAGPMMGLFGTVFGMIVTFGKMVASGGAPKPTELAGGIATALVCTFWGLVVGIPGVITAAIFRVRIEGLTAEAIYKGQQLLGQFKPGATVAAPKKPATATASAAPATPKPAPASA